MGRQATAGGFGAMVRLLVLAGGVVGAADAAAQERSPQRGAESGRPVIVAHRGLLKHAPENTLSAFRACFELGLGVELDVRRSQDGVLVCVHDATVDRTSDGSGSVTELPLERLRALDVGGWFDPTFRGARMPTLDDAFALLAEYPSRGTQIAVDLKGDDPRIEPDVVEAASRHGVLDRLVFIGRTIDNEAVRDRLKQADGAAQVSQLVKREQWSTLCKRPQLDWLYARFVPSAEEVRAAHTAGKRVFVAGPTVAGIERENWQAAARNGVDAILTDFPLELAELLRQER